MTTQKNSASFSNNQSHPEIGLPQAVGEEDDIDQNQEAASLESGQNSPQPSSPQVIVDTATLATLPQQSTPPPPEPQSNRSSAQNQKRTIPILQWYSNQTIGRKQLIALMASELISILGLSVGATWIITTGLRTQLLNQAGSEVVVTENNYNVKLNQMGLGFRGQSDNPLIIEAAKFHEKGQTLTPNLQAQVKQLLKDETKSRQIEYATLVGKDLQIIVNANANRQGETFNPNNLVSEVLSNGKQIKASAIVPKAELAKESPALPSGFDNQDALIRYTVTPVRDRDTKAVIGALVSGDIVNGKPSIVTETLKAFKGGYSAVYLRKPTGEFALATSLDQGKATDLKQAQSNVALADKSLLAAAAKAPKGQPVTDRMVVGSQTYTIAAQALPNKIIEEESGSVPDFTQQPAAILVRGTPETASDDLLNQSLQAQLVVLLLAVGVISIWAIVLRRAIVKPVEQLEETTDKFTRGNRQVRAEISSIDEVGQLAQSFNRMADSIVTTEAALVEQSRRQEAEKNIVLRIRKSLNLEDVINTTVKELRQALKTDRVIIYRFNPDWSGTIIAESVALGWTKSLGETINDPFREGYIEMYTNGRVRATNNVEEAGFTDCHRDILKRFEIKANIVAPILENNNKLLGLLCAHHCSEPRTWQKWEIDLFTQIAIQVGFAIDQANLLEQQKAKADQERLFTTITLRIRQSLNLEDILNTAVKETRLALKADRVLIYRLDQTDWDGTVIAESVAPGWPEIIGVTIDDPCFKDRHVNQYRRGRVNATNNIYEEPGLSNAQCYIKMLEPFGVKANLVAPIMKDKQLLGLMIAHQCSEPRDWQQFEIDLFTQLATQVGFALDQVSLLEQIEQARQSAERISEEQRQQKEELQMQLVQLLSDVEGASNGDLTVRADVTVGEIGTVADFFNAIIESLRQTVIHVKNTAFQVSTSVGQSESAVRELAEEALKQTAEITRTLDSVEQMTLSIQDVANSARQAAAVARNASATAEAGGAAMDLTVQSILSLRETVAETAKKVKRLGESSQKISKIVSLINQIALQTNVLAINASIEAARAGEEGRGFAVVAEEVGELAARSAGATKEIEKIVENIQLETSEVVRAMELGTTQVVEGTNLVEDTKQSLGQILEVSRQIDQLVQSISNATVSQAQTSQAVTNLMKEIANVSERTSDSSLQVSKSLKLTVEVTQELQASVGVFKVSDDD